MTYIEASNSISVGTSPHTHWGSLQCSSDFVYLDSMGLFLTKREGRREEWYRKGRGRKGRGLQWSSGSTFACGARGPRFESRCRQKVFVFCTNITAIRSFGHGLHILTAVPLVDSAFHPPRDGKWVSTLWLSTNTNGDGRMFGVWQPTGGLKGQVCSLAYELAPDGLLELTDFRPV